MGADTKAIKNRIRSVDSTLHLTRAMGLVASSKIRRAMDRMNRSKDYSSAYDAVITQLSACPECMRSIYMAQNAGSRERILVIAGDRGLAGGYNANVFRLAQSHPDAQWIPIGKRACDRFGQKVISSETFGPQDALELAHRLCKDFENGEYDRLGVLYTRYISMMIQEADLMWLLPIARTEKVSSVSAVFEPDEMSVLKQIIPQYISGKLMSAVRESFACEVAARRMAMDSAGKNAQQMIDTLQIQYNRERQNAITQEISEIVAGSGE